MMRGTALAAALLALAACTVGPDFQPPKTTAPAQYGAEPGDVASTTYGGAMDAAWWRSFHDPELDSLVARLATQNLDLRTAAERVIQGRAQTEAALSQGLPHIDYTPSYTHSRQSPKGFISLVTPAPGAPLEYDLFKNMVSASWELDLFGRVRRAVEAERANTEAAEAARRAVALAAVSDLGQSYLSLRGVQAREAIARANLALAHQDTELVVTRFGQGVGTTLDVAQARAQEARIAATLPAFETTQAALINAIGLELAQPPRALERELRAPAAQPPVPPRVPVGLPSELARRRPDIVEAEAKLHAATAQTGVAVASFYPDISLVGDFGMQGLRFADAFNLPARAADIGPNIDLPIFQGGRLTAQLTLRKSQQREAAIAYQKTVLTAWREVDDALTAYAQAQKQRTDDARVVDESAKALAAAQAQFREGQVDYLNVVSARAGVLSSQSTLAQDDATIATDLVSLYRALGGGWQDVVGPTPVAPG